MHWNLMNDEEFGSFKFLKLANLQNWLTPKKLGPLPYNLRKFQKTEKRSAESCRIHWYLSLNDNEFGTLKFLKLKYRKGDQIVQLFRIISSPQETRSPLFNLGAFQKTEKITADSCRMHWNLKKVEEFGYFKFLKMKYRRGDQLIHLFCRIGSP